MPRRLVFSFSLSPRFGRWLAAGVAGLLSFAVPVDASMRRGESSAMYAMTRDDQALLDSLQRASLLFFLEQTDRTTGLTRDRAPADGSAASAPASIAATGFALSAFCIGDERGWLPRGEALQRVRTSLRFVAEHVEHQRGWFYHFVHVADGRRAWECEASTIDTALFLQGALFAREYFRDPEVTAAVQRIYERIDWRWAQNGYLTLSHGWMPESGFIKHRWDSYSEMLGLYLLGIGAPRQPLPPASWHAWRRGPVVEYGGRSFIQCAPLFTHQYSHGWFDFRGRRDLYADYWKNSVNATLAQRDWCAAQTERFPLWSRDLWGLTASDSERGYVAWGTPLADHDTSDGTLVPCAPGGSLPFAPEECITALRRMREIGGDHVWRRYGFVDAFNPHTGWASPDVIGIDVGITLVMAENLRSGLVWKSFMAAPEVQRAFKLAGFNDSPRLPVPLLATLAP